MTLLERLWEGLTGVQQPPSSAAIWWTALAVVAAVAFRPAWRILRHLVTIVHEGGHATAAVLTGRRLRGIRLHSDSSGVTLSQGRPRGFGMLLTLIAGYLAPALFGLLAAGLLWQRHALAVLWVALLLLSLMLLQIRNFHGLYSMLVAGLAVFAVSWWGAEPVQSLAAYGFTWFLLLAGPVGVIDLQRARRAGRARGSDADQLAGLTRVPAAVWAGVLFLLTVAALVVGGWLIWPR
ncbi:MAG: M50 family metallopeptidase [Micropruina sp.]|uniref:M50 family metallopeptidase n=1 Tax=Micropruina sp. TaxID=2737536 RepID=UPI0039E3F269